MISFLEIFIKNTVLVNSLVLRCHQTFKFGDFNEDGFVDIYIDGTAADKVEWLRDGAIYMSTGKFTYDIVQTRDEDYPLIKLEIKKSLTKLKTVY